MNVFVFLHCDSHSSDDDLEDDSDFSESEYSYTGSMDDDQSSDHYEGYIINHMIVGMFEIFLSWFIIYYSCSQAKYNIYILKVILLAKLLLGCFIEMLAIKILVLTIMI